GFSLIIRLRSDRRRGSGPGNCQGGMSERSKQFGSENKILVNASHAPAPDLRPLRLKRSVEGGVDLNHIEKLRQVLERVDLLAGQIIRIEHTIPVLVGPSCRANHNFAATLHYL